MRRIEYAPLLGTDPTSPNADHPHPPTPVRPGPAHSRLSRPLPGGYLRTVRIRPAWCDAIRELAEREGVEAYLIDGAIEIDPHWVQGRKRIGITAGASAPEVLVRGVIERLRELGAEHVAEQVGEQEDMVFALPKELRVQLVD